MFKMQNNIMMPCDKIFSIIEVKLAHLLFPHNDEIVALTDKITCELLIQAYNQGYFPWPFDSCDLIPWYNPRKRGILEFTDLIIPKSWLKLKRQKELYCSLNKDFESVITHCRDVHQSRNDNTWINEHIIQAYSELHRRGMALSVEVWEKDQLIGGLYGVDINRLFTGESMFYLKKKKVTEIIS